MRLINRIGLAVVLIACGAHTASAGTYIFTGVFATDDQQASFNLLLDSPGILTIQTTSYANGGFAPVLSIFGSPDFGPGDPTLLAYDAGGTAPNCGIRGTNAATGACLDAVLGFDSVLNQNPLGTLPAGAYLVVLTEQSNTPNGPDLASGFAQDGQGNFTAVPGINDGPFVDPTNFSITDSPNWAVTFQNVDSASQTPEPSTLLSIVAGFAVLAGLCLRRSTPKTPRRLRPLTTAAGRIPG
jgi:hypothetical protein